MTSLSGKKFLAIITAAAFYISLTASANKFAIDSSSSKIMSNYYADLQECKSLAEQNGRVGSNAIAGLASGALIGAASAALTGGDNSWAKYGAGSGAIEGVAGAAWYGYEEKKRVVLNCLVGRGYTVLN